jgi:hypothetical protein
MRQTTAAVLLLLAIAAPLELAAQHRSPRGLREARDDGRYNRSGLWGEIGIGAGSESFNANDGLGWSDGQGGGVGFFKIGGTVSPSFLLGVEGQVWTKRYYGPDYDRSLGSLMFIGQAYPSPRDGFWFKGGFGIARDELNLFGGGPQPTVSDQNGLAIDLGLGYDVRVSRGVSFTPSLDLVMQRYDQHQERLINLGFGVTFH